MDSKQLQQLKFTNLYLFLLDSSTQSPTFDPTTGLSSYADDVLLVQDKSLGDTEINLYGSNYNVKNLTLQHAKTRIVDLSKPTFSYHNFWLSPRPLYISQKYNPT